MNDADWNGAPKDLVVWKTFDTEHHRHLALRTIGGIVGIIVLAFVCMTGLAMSPFYGSRSMRGVTWTLFLLITFTLVYLATLVGKVVNREQQVFFVDRGTGILYTCLVSADVNVRGSGLLLLVRYSKYLRESERDMEQIMQMLRSGRIPAGALQIAQTNDIVEKKTEYIVNCTLASQTMRTYIISKKYDNIELLIRELELRGAGAHNGKENKFVRNSIYLALADVVSVVLCLQFREMYGALASALYYIFLITSYVGIVTLIVYIARRGH